MIRRLAAALAPALALACADPASAPSTAAAGASFARLGVGDQGGRPFTAALSGANEVSPTGALGAGDPDGTGTARITVNAGQGQICYEIAVANIVLPARMAHIHEGPAGANGPVRVNLNAPDANGVSSGCASVSRDFAKELAADPANYYVNVHNQPFPGGAVRGQLR